jgi:hypothetical protein
MEGRKQGYDQILWLLGPDFQVTEVSQFISTRRQFLNYEPTLLNILRPSNNEYLLTPILGWSQ